jgi:hypothetical protein
MISMRTLSSTKVRIITSCFWAPSSYPSIRLALTHLLTGPTANFIVEEAKLIPTQAADLFSTAPAMRKRLYQIMVEIAIINERVRVDMGIRADHIDDAADIQKRLDDMDESGAVSA